MVGMMVLIRSKTNISMLRINDMGMEKLVAALSLAIVIGIGILAIFKVGF
jgi:hypothetical protein